MVLDFAALSESSFRRDVAQMLGGISEEHVVIKDAIKSSQSTVVDFIVLLPDDSDGSDEKTSTFVQQMTERLVAAFGEAGVLVAGAQTAAAIERNRITDASTPASSRSDQFPFWWSAEIHSDSETRDAFDRADTDGSGAIDRDEVKQMLKDLGQERVTKSELDAAMRDMDLDGDGDVSFEEFKAWLNRQSVTDIGRWILRHRADTLAPEVYTTLRAACSCNSDEEFLDSRHHPCSVKSSNAEAMQETCQACVRTRLYWGDLEWGRKESIEKLQKSQEDDQAEQELLDILHGIDVSTDKEDKVVEERKATLDESRVGLESDALTGPDTRPINCVIVGDSMAGKTSLLQAILECAKSGASTPTRSAMPVQHIPTTFDNCTTSPDGKLELWDTSGDDEI
eukprot:COSAG06_NODE_6348_length_2974_cov_2.264000_2_plen_396_part_00